MIKRRTKPLTLRKMEALLRRLPTNHPQLSTIKSEIAKSYQGYIGEKKVDYQLEMLPKEYTILHDIYLKNPQVANFQVDSLLITDYALFIVETKNFNGKITFNTIHNQFTRTTGGREEGYRYPITQAEMTQMKLGNWLHQHNIHKIPIYSYVAISDPSTIIDVIGDAEAIAKIVAHGEYIPKKIMEQNEMEQQQGNPQTSWKRNTIARTILQYNEEFNENILQKFNINHTDLLTGVICPYCNQYSMIRINAKWKCRKCEKESNSAHKQAIEDYFLLNNNYITNTDCQKLLHLNSRYIARNLLKRELDYNIKHRYWTKKPSQPTISKR